MVDEVTFQFEYIRRSGACNMLDRPYVESLAEQNDFQELQEVAKSNRSYSNFIADFKIVDDVLYQQWLEDSNNMFLDNDMDTQIYV